MKFLELLGAIPAKLGGGDPTKAALMTAAVAAPFMLAGPAGAATGAKVAGTTAGKAATDAGWAALLKQGAANAGTNAAMSTAAQAAMPQYNQTQMLMQPGPMQAAPDMMSQLQQLMARKKGLM